MSKPARQPLSALPFERKATAAAPAPAEVEAPAAAEVVERAALPAKAKDEDGKVPVMVRMRPAERKLIRQIAIGLDTTVQGLLEEAITDIIRRHRGAMNL